MNGIPLRKVAVACALALSGVVPAGAQQGSNVPQGLYSETIQHDTYLQKGSKTINLPKGQAGFADTGKLKKLDVIPNFMTYDRTLPPGEADNLRGCGAYDGAAPALSDLPLQSDFERYDRHILDEIGKYLKSGYPPASVMLHAATMGVPIDQVMYAAVKAEPLRTQELYTTALQIMAFLPGWTCAGDLDRGSYDPVYNVNDLPNQRLVKDVADRYFKNRARLAEFPDWPHDEFNMLASADELLNLLSKSGSRFWYRPGPHEKGPGANPRDSVLISLYPDNQTIVIDTPAERIRKWKAEGKERIPVTFFYNFKYQRPMSRFGDNATLKEVINAFFNKGLELTPVPLFTVGDYHLMVPGKDLEDLFDIPKDSEIDPKRYKELANDLTANGFSKKPVLVTLLRDGHYKRLAEPDRVRVALDQGIKDFPVALFYHRLDRQACGAPASCFDQLCTALVCAGGDPNSCLSATAAGAVRESAFEVPTGGGGGGSPPPPSPPPPPPPPPASPS